MNEATTAPSGDSPAIPIEDLDLPVGTYSRLKRGGVHFVSSLTSYFDDELQGYFHLTQRDIDDVQAKLVPLGLSIKL